MLGGYGDPSVVREIFEDDGVICAVYRDSIGVSTYQMLMRVYRPRTWGGIVIGGSSLFALGSTTGTTAGAIGDAASGYGLVGTGWGISWNSQQVYGDPGAGWLGNRVGDGADAVLYDKIYSFGRRFWLNNPDIDWDFVGLYPRHPSCPNGKFQHAVGPSGFFGERAATIDLADINGTANTYYSASAALTKTRLDGLTACNFPLQVKANQTVAAGSKLYCSEFGFRRRDRQGLTMVYSTIKNGFGAAAYNNSGFVPSAAWAAHIAARGDTHAIVGMDAHPGADYATDLADILAMIDHIREGNSHIGILMVGCHPLNSNETQQTGYVIPARIEACNQRSRVWYFDAFNEWGGEQDVLDAEFTGWDGAHPVNDLQRRAIVTVEWSGMRGAIQASKTFAPIGRGIVSGLA